MRQARVAAPPHRGKRGTRRSKARRAQRAALSRPRPCDAGRVAIGGWSARLRLVGARPDECSFCLQAAVFRYGGGRRPRRVPDSTVGPPPVAVSLWRPSRRARHQASRCGVRGANYRRSARRETYSPISTASSRTAAAACRRPVAARSLLRFRSESARLVMNAFGSFAARLR
jgi:hypothetical protein